MFPYKAILHHKKHVVCTQTQCQMGYFIFGMIFDITPLQDTNGNTRIDLSSMAVAAFAIDKTINNEILIIHSY